MIDKNLVNIIIQNLNKGFSIADIQNMLIRSGYPPQNINDSITYVYGANRNMPAFNQDMQQSVEKKSSKKVFLFIGIAIVILIILGVISYFLIFNKITEDLNQSSTEENGQEIVIVSDFESIYESNNCTEDCSQYTCENCNLGTKKCGKRAIVADSECLECTRDGDCNGGYRCDDNICILDTRTFCEEDSDCADIYCEGCAIGSQKCIGSSGNRFCKECRIFEDDCKEGYTCEQDWGCVSDDLVLSLPDCTENCTPKSCGPGCTSTGCRKECNEPCEGCDEDKQGKQSCIYTNDKDDNPLNKCADCINEFGCKEGYMCYRYQCVVK